MDNQEAKESMTLKQIMEIANEVYPDDLIKLYAENPRKNHGDGLAKFIVRELTDTFEKKADAYDQLHLAGEVLHKATNELTAVVKAFCLAKEKLGEHRKAKTIEAARRILGAREGALEVDDNAEISRADGENGCYVQAWVWVPDEEAEG